MHHNQVNKLNCRNKSQKETRKQTDQIAKKIFTFIIEAHWKSKQTLFIVKIISTKKIVPLGKQNPLKWFQK